MDQIGVRQLAFLLLCASMVVVGSMGLVGMVSAGPGLLAAILAAMVALSFSAGRLSASLR